MPRVLITGANRGIGNGLVAEFLSHGWHVIGCCRQPASDCFGHCQNTDKLRIVELDVTNQHQINELAKSCENKPIDILLNVAGIYGPSGLRFGNTPVDAWLEVFKINSIAPLKLAEALIEPVCCSQLKMIVAISSEMASMETNQFGNAYLYRSSKAALNSVIKSLSIDLQDKGVKSLAIHPGWVKTDMGGVDAEISAQQSAAGIFKILSQPKSLKSGGFYDFQGNELPW